MEQDETSAVKMIVNFSLLLLPPPNLQIPNQSLFFSVSDIFSGYRVQSPVILTFAFLAVLSSRFPSISYRSSPFWDLQVLATNSLEDLTPWKAIFKELQGP
jgi:hypothetical protein